MSTIKLSTTDYTPIPEGTHTFKVLEVKYDKDFGKLDIGLVLQSGRKHNERFHLINSAGEANEKVLTVFSIFARNVLNDFSLDEIDPDELVGHYVTATVEHNKVTSNKDPDKELTFVNLANYAPAEGFDVPTAESNDDDFDLDDLLG